jgi:hypothetical protein
MRGPSVDKPLSPEVLDFPSCYRTCAGDQAAAQQLTETLTEMANASWAEIDEKELERYVVITSRRYTKH